jgi:hypothetical protein
MMIMVPRARRRPRWWTPVPLVLLVVTAGCVRPSSEGVVHPSPESSAVTNPSAGADASRYWTEEHIAGASPAPMPTERGVESPE